MCWYLTLAIPPAFPLPASERGMGVRPIQDDGFPQDWTCFEVSSGMCACGLYVPPGETTENHEHTADDLRARYRRKEWSLAKIERALRDREGGRTRRAARMSANPDRFRDRVVEWANRYGEIGIRAHWEGRELDDSMRERPARSMFMNAMDFRRDGFPPEVFVLIRATTIGGSHGADLDQ